MFLEMPTKYYRIARDCHIFLPFTHGIITQNTNPGLKATAGQRSLTVVAGFVTAEKRH